MAFGNPHWEVRTGGDDTNNGGGFDTAATNSFPTDGAATSATSAAPVFSSASYNFVSPGDVGAWLFIRSGTNWTPGWYNITAVSANKATLNATAGQAVLFNTNALPGFNAGVSTAAGCATTASPTSATWGIDYSQQNSAQFTSTTLAIGNPTTTNLTDGSNTIGKNWVGNIISVTSGTGFTVQRVLVTSTSGTTATVDKSLGTAGSTNGHGKLGGPLASIGQAGANLNLANASVWVKSGSYSITSASTNVSGGCLSATNGTGNRIEGYGTYRSDLGTAPVLTASGISTATIIATSITNNHVIRNLTVDGASLTAIRCFDLTGIYVSHLTAKNAKNNGFAIGNSNGGYVYNCRATGCATTDGAFLVTGGQPCTLIGCIADGNSVSGFKCSISPGSQFLFCISASNTGASSDGFIGASQLNCINCTAYANGRHAYNLGSTTNTNVILNCIAEGHAAGWGVTGDSSVSNCTNHVVKYCAFFNNNSGDIDTTTNGPHITAAENNVTYTSTAFTNAGSGNFGLTQTSTGGAKLRGTGFAGVFANSFGTTGYIDIGAVQAPFAKPGFGGVGFFIS